MDVVHAHSSIFLVVEALVLVFMHDEGLRPIPSEDGGL